MSTLYRLLGVSDGADANEIKSAYRALARKYHPDHNGGHPLAERRFRLLAEAYEVLSDAEKREKYDRYGKAALAKRADQPGLVGGMQRLLTNVEQALEARRRGLKKRGEDRRLPLEVTLAQAVHGATVPVSITRTGTCDACRGNGAEPGTSLDTCHVCEGRGSTREGSGLLSTDTPCVFCDARGKVAPSPCTGCDGLGIRERTLSVPVSIPPNARAGRRLVLRGYGTAGVNGGESGDLFVELTVASHPLFDRDGDDLRCTVPITLGEAVLGGEATVPLLDGGSVTVRIPPGTRSGQQLRLRGRGGPLERGGRGDLLVRLDIETPVVDSSVAREVLARLEQVSIHPLRAAYKSALSKHPRRHGRVTTLQGRGEGELIALVRRVFREHSPLEVGIGDDGAVFLASGPCVAVADAMMEDVHFSRAFCPPADVGRKLVAVNVSDLAAMGARPTVALFTASLPKDLPWAWAQALVEGVGAEAARWGLTVCGGDVTGSPGPVSLSFTALGTLAGAKPLKRSDARPGDRVWVSGPLGGAAHGLRHLMAGTGTLAPDAVARQLAPTPRMDVGLALAGWDGVGAVMDLSDGLAQDLPRLAAASGVRIVIDLGRIPIHAELARDDDDALAIAVNGGEDYELVFTGRGAAPVGAVEIGTVEAGAPALVWRHGVREVSVPPIGGFSHF